MAEVQPVSYESALDIANQEIAKQLDELKAINLYIHSNPELNFEEHKAHDAIVALLKKLNFPVTPHAYGVPTSFESEVGSGGRLFVFNAEYDALPEIGHACGHNLIATGSIAAFLGAAAVLQKTKIPGRVRLLGTPAEEGGGGKLELIAKGAYESVDACMMAHPAPLHANYAKEFNGDIYRRQVACSQFGVSFKGKNAHAAFAPWQGINALDAVVLGYSGISMLRQQMKPSDKVHGIIANGGVKPNIIPDLSHVEYMVRTKSLAENVELKNKVINCFVGAATATGCELEILDGVSYADVVPNEGLCTLFTEEMGKLGLPMWCDNGSEEYIGGATDQGNVCQVCPSIHPNYGIPAPEGSYNHTIGFTAAAISEEGFDRTMTVAKGMAMTAWTILTNDSVANGIMQEFEEFKKTLPPYDANAFPGSLSLAGKPAVQMKCTCAHFKD